MPEYIEREAIGEAYMDLCLAKSKLAKSRKGAAFFQSDLLPETEPTVKELFRLVMAMPAADVAPVVRCWQCKHHEREQDPCHGRTQHYCKKLKAEVYKDFFCGYGARMDGE